MLKKEKVLMIAKRLAATIPPPAKKKSKPTKSYRLLKEGQFLENNQEVLGYKKGTVWKVTSTSSVAAFIQVTNNPEATIRWNIDELGAWSGYFKRIRKPTK